MISSIDIGSFRGIRSLKLENLAMVNILTGDNNCGKTSVLEILDSFSQPDDFWKWSSLTRRDTRGILPYRNLSLYESFYDLFDIDAEEKRIEYTIEMDGEVTKVSVLAKESYEELNEDEIAEIQDISRPVIKKEGQLSDVTYPVARLEAEIWINDERINKNDLYEGQIRFSKVREMVNREFSEKIIYISPVRHAEGNIFLSQVLNIPEMYEEMLTVLKEYDENIISINYDKESDSLPGRGVYKILSKSHKKALPLNVYGDGMKKAVLLMSAVVRAQNGILLLDEFETAIHTSAMDKTFKWILEACRKLNVQLFLTSHSKEAIDKVLKCAPDHMDDIAVYTLYKDETGTVARRLSARKAIEVQDEMGLELR